MHIKSLLVAAAAALAMIVAPTASAATTQQSCTADGAGTECQSPGNVELNDSPPAVSYDPYGDYGLAIGGFGSPFGGFRGGFHGGGGGHR